MTKLLLTASDKKLFGKSFIVPVPAHSSASLVIPPVRLSLALAMSLSSVTEDSTSHLN